MHYLATAYSFEGRYDDAVEAAKELLQFKENPAQAAAVDGIGTARAQGWFAMLRTLVQFEKWDVILQGDTLPVLARPRQEAWRHWARTLALANTGKVAAAVEEAAAFDAALADYRTRTKRSNPEELDVARLEMQAHLELAAGHTSAALKQFEKSQQGGAQEAHLYRALVLSPSECRTLGPCRRKGESAWPGREGRERSRSEQYPNDSHVPPVAAGSSAN